MINDEEFRDCLKENMAKEINISLDEAAFEKSRAILSSIQCDRPNDIVFIEGGSFDINGYALQDIAATKELYDRYALNNIGFENAILGIRSPSKELAGIDQFELANIKLTDEQREALEQFGISFKGFAEAMLTAMQGILKPMSDLADAILKIPELQKPEPTFAKRKKPWKRDRFYD